MGDASSSSAWQKLANGIKAGWSEHKALTSNAFWSLLNQTLRTAGLAVWMLMLTRFLPPDQFGVLVFGFSFVKVFSVVASFGLDKIIIHYCALQDGLSKLFLIRAFYLKLAGSVLAYISMLLIVCVFVPDSRTILSIVMLSGLSLFFQAFDVLDFFFQAKGEMRWIFIARGSALCISFILKGMALLSSGSLLTLAGLEAIEAVLIASGLILVFIVRRHPPSTVKHFPSRKTLFAESLPLFLSAIAIIIYMRVDILMLGRMAGTTTAGIYAAAAQLSEVWAFIPIALAPVIFPSIVKWNKLEATQYLRKYQKVIQVSVLMAFSIAVFLSFTAANWINLIYGERYAPAAGVLVIHVWSGVFIFLGIAQSGFDVVERLTWLGTARMTIGLMINIGLNFWLIPLYSAKGAALATLVAYGFSAWLLNAAHRKTRPIFWMQTKALLMVPAWNQIFGKKPAFVSASSERPAL